MVHLTLFSSNDIPESLIVHAILCVPVESEISSRLFLFYLVQQLAQINPGLSWPKECAPCVGEHKDNVLAHRNMEPTKNLIEHILKEYGESGFCWVKQNTDTMQAIVLTDKVQYVFEVHLILLIATSITQSGCVYESDQSLPEEKAEASALLCG